MKRPLHRWLAAWCVAALAACASPTSTPDANGEPRGRCRHVLFLAVDDLRPELGCYGAAHAHTPNIDRLAARGVVFERAYCQSAVCNPSRASLMTGLRPETIGVLDLSTDLRRVMPDVVTLPQHLRAAGWTTCSVGKIYHNIFPDEPSWDERHYVEGFPFDPDAVYLGDEGRAIQQRRITTMRTRGTLERRRDRFGHIYVKAQATEAPDVADSAYYDGAQTDWAVDKLGQLAAGDRPFVLAVGFYRPHLPFNAPKRYWDLYDRASLPLCREAGPPKGAPPMASNTMRELRGYSDFTHLVPPQQLANGDGPRMTEAEHRRLLHGYLASVSYVDAQIGRLLDRLDALGIANDTLIVLWGDHGWKLGDHGSWGKMTNFEVDTRAPLLIASPAHRPGRAQGLVEFVDVFPTVCELLGVAPPPDREGESLVPLLVDPKAPGHEAAFSQYLRSGIWMEPNGVPTMGRAVRTATMRYVRWRRQADGELVGEELYDHASDPRERRNVAEDPRYATALRRHRELLSRGFGNSIVSGR